MSIYLGVEESVLRDLGGEHTAKEISQQPRIWRDTIAEIVKRRPEINLFLNPILAKQKLRVLLSGAGTSAFAGKAMAPHLSRVTGRRFEAISTTDIVASPADYLAEQVPTLIISFARSGNSPESVAAVKLASQCLHECYHLILTCNPAGELAKLSELADNMLYLVMPEGSNDKGFAMTSSYTSMMLSALCIFDANQATVGRVDQISQLTEQLLDKQCCVMKELAKRDFDRMVFLGSSSLQGLAQEAALKFLELTAGEIVSVFDSPLGFRHGPKSIINNKTVVVEFLSSDEYTRQYDIDLLSELRRDNKAGYILAISQKKDDGAIKGNIIELDDAERYENIWLCFPFIVLAQVLAFFKSIYLQIKPDNPCPSGEVNRIVQGVIIHDFQSR